MSEPEDSQEISPKSTPPPVPSQPSSRVASLDTLQSWLPLYLKKSDRAVSHLSRILSTPSGTDTFLMTICYSSLAASRLLSSISLHRLHAAARKLMSAASDLPANTTIIIETGSLRTPLLIRLSNSLKALSDLIGDFRIFVRLWGLLGIWKWGKSLLDDPPADLVLKRIAWAQVLVNVLYQFLENGAYLASKGVLEWSADKQTKAWIWSSRFWAAHVALDFWRLAHERDIRRAKLIKAMREGNASKVAKERGRLQEEKAWRKDMVVNLAYAPLTVHWSLEKGIVGDVWVGLLGAVAGVAGLRELWKETS